MASSHLWLTPVFHRTKNRYDTHYGKSSFPFYSRFTQGKFRMTATAQQQFLDFGVSENPAEYAHFYGDIQPKPDGLAPGTGAWSWFSVVQHDPRKVDLRQRGDIRKGRKVNQQSYPLHMLPEVVSAIDPRLNSYITQSEFAQPNRRIVNLWRLGVVWLDMDTYKTPWGTERSQDAQVRDLLWILADKGYPEPSLVMSSGRGLYLKWFHEGLPRPALPRWNAVMREITREMTPWGSDAAAKDASRVLRIAGTVNSRSGDVARVLHVTPNEQGLPIRYGFDFLSECFLPLSREQVHEKRRAAIARHAEYEAKQAEYRKRRGFGQSVHKEYPNLRPFSAQQLAWDRVEDLRRLTQIRKDSGQGLSGARELMLFWQMNHLLLSQQVNLQTFWQESRALAAELDPDWARGEGRNTLGSLFTKAKTQLNGEKVEFDGRLWNPLYTPKNQTLIDVFRMTPDEERQMKTIISPGMARERARVRDRERKLEMRRAMGMKAHGTNDLRAQAVAMVKERGMSYRKAAGMLDVPVATVHRWANS